MTDAPEDWGKPKPKEAEIEDEAKPTRTATGSSVGATLRGLVPMGLFRRRVNKAQTASS